MDNHVTLFSFFRDMGPVVWLLFPILGIVVFLIVQGILDILRSPKKPITIYRRQHSLLFWGSLAALLGFAAQILGLWQAILVIIAAENISPVILMAGLRISFYSTIFGLFIMVLALIGWFVLTRIVLRRMDD